jgi:hypothetical protein
MEYPYDHFATQHDYQPIYQELVDRDLPKPQQPSPYKYQPAPAPEQNYRAPDRSPEVPYYDNSASFREMFTGFTPQSAMVQKTGLSPDTLTLMMFMLVLFVLLAIQIQWMGTHISNQLTMACVSRYNPAYTAPRPAP